MVRPDDTREDVVNRADDLLYHSKESGRDRVTIDEHEAKGG
jgi:PleD family two-component response regulator